jgi:hypothetical protein
MATTFGNACPQQHLTWPEYVNEKQRKLQETLKELMGDNPGLKDGEDCA